MNDGFLLTGAARTVLGGYSKLTATDDGTTPLSGLVPKKKPKELSDEDRAKLSGAQQQAVTNAEERAKMAARAAGKTVERSALYRTQISAAASRIDPDTAERAAQAAKMAATLAKMQAQDARSAADEAGTKLARANQAAAMAAAARAEDMAQSMKAAAAEVEREAAAERRRKNRMPPGVEAKQKLNNDSE